MATRDLEEILRDVRRVQIVARRQVNDLMAGEYASAFKGRGMEFDSVREYVPGDDIRNIDWNVTARSESPFVKTFCEERELTIMVAVDVSASNAFGSNRQSKLDIAAEVAAVLMFTALTNNDRVGLLLFAEDIVRYIPPRKGRGSVLRLIRELLTVEPVRAQTNLSLALEYLGKVQRRRCVVFWISDFLTSSFDRSLRITNQKHDCVAVTITDPREEEIPNVGFVTLQDAETGKMMEFDTSSKVVRTWLRARIKQRRDSLEQTLRQAGVDRLDIRTDQPYAKSLHAFFHRREKLR
jgi:uncharacterized protein (DUF58 family)